MVEFEDIHWFKDKISQLKYSKKKVDEKKSYYQKLLQSSENNSNLLYLLKKQRNKLKRIDYEMVVYKNTMRRLVESYSLHT